MARFLFWNVNQSPNMDLIAGAAREQDVDVVVLAECRALDANFIRVLNRGENRLFMPGPANSQSRLTFLTRFPRQCLSVVDMNSTPQDRFTIRRFRIPMGDELLLVAVHLPDKRNSRDGSQAQFATRMRSVIDDAERRVGHTRTVVFGDFNMNPFEDGMVGSESFHSTMSRGIALQGSRQVHAGERTFFYNPMWSMYGDGEGGAPATYYRRGSEMCELFWHMLDQVLVRPSLIERFQLAELQILNRIQGQSPLNRNGTPNDKIASDHLPIVFQVDT